MSVSTLEAPSFQTRPLEIPIRTILDPRFPQPGRYSEFGVPQVLRPAADVLYRALIDCPERSARRPVGGICTSEADGALVEVVASRPTSGHRCRRIAGTVFFWTARFPPIHPGRTEPGPVPAAHIFLRDDEIELARAPGYD